jgi:DNA-binding PadR family transcriptional regulator
MPIHHAVLALLAGRASHGYELKASFERAVGPQWGELNIGHVYQVLDRLEREGFVTQRVVRQADRPDKTVYRLTRAGRDELERWLEAPFVREGGYRDDFFLKLFAGSQLGPDALASVVRVQRQAYLQELSSLGQLRARYGDDALVHLLIEAAIRHTEANLAIVEQAERNADELVRQAGEPSAAAEKPAKPSAGAAR